MTRALIGPTGYGSYGVVWRDFPAMEGRGGYSGPFKTAQAAAEQAQAIAEHYGAGRIGVEYVENVNQLDREER